MHRAFLLTWNPRVFPWDEIEAEAEADAVLEGRPEPGSWSCGNSKQIRAGDRLFLLRQGVEPRGIVAAGWATSDVFGEPHWDDEKAERGITANYVAVRFERILVPERDDPLPLATLKDGELRSVHWSTQQSGIAIKAGVEQLEHLWRRHLDNYDVDAGDGLSAIEGGVTYPFTGLVRTLVV